MMIKMIKEILNPNCSEVVWRLDISQNTEKAIIRSLECKDIKCRTATDSYPNHCVDDILEVVEDVDNIDDFSIDIIENNGGGGDVGYVEKCFEIVKEFKKGDITKEEMRKLEEVYWG